MDLRQLQSFVDVVQCGSFAAVADKQDIDPSSVSRAISALEADLTLRLFQRSTRKLALTEAGERYYQRVKPILIELARAGDDAKSLVSVPSGKLKLTASVAFGQVWLLERLDRFMVAYPEIEIELVLSDHNLDLLGQDIDVAFRLAPALDTNLIGTKLFATRYHVCASPDYLKNHPPLATPQDLMQHNAVVLNMPGYRTRWHFKHRNGSIDEVDIRSRLAVSGALALLDSALKGRGPVLIADWLVQAHLVSGALINPFPDYRVTATDFETAAWLLYPSRQYLPHKTRVLIDFIKAQIVKAPILS